MNKGIEIALRRIETCKRERSNQLDLGSLGINELPEGIIELEWLEYLDIGSEDYDKGYIYEYEYQGNGYFPILKGEKEHVEKNYFTTIPDQICQLNNLKTLDLRGNSLTCIKHPKQNESIKCLYLSENEITDIQGIVNFVNLEELDLTRNKIKEISPISNLNKLQSLRLSHNEIVEANFGGKNEGLIKLFLNNNNISEIKHFSFLKSLKILEIFRNNIEGDLIALKNCHSLECLNFGANAIYDLSGLEECVKLKKIYAFSNYIRNIDPLLNCKGLEELCLRNNNIVEIRGLEHLSNLKILELSSNNLKRIPSGISSLPNLIVLDLHDNIDLFKTIPEEIIMGEEFVEPDYDEEEQDTGTSRYWNCLSDIVSWEKDLALSSVINQSVRVILCGNGRVGKSSVLDALQGRHYNPNKKTTHAIEIEKLVVPNQPDDLECWVWDLGGQEVYHTTHRVFMGGKAIFLVVWDKDTEGALSIEDPLDPGTKYPNFRLRYWLHTIRSVSPESPVIIVQNKTNIHDWTLPTAEQVPPHFKVRHFVSVSAETGEGIEMLKRYISDVAKEIPDYRMTVPASWWKVREHILEMKANNSAKVMEYSDFEKLCREKGVLPASIASLLRFFSNTSLCYTIDFEDRRKIVIDQKWVIEPVYKVFDRGSSFYKALKRWPRFTPDEICDAWGDQYSEEEKELFLEFMEDIGICFKINSKKSIEFFVPQFCNDEPPQIAKGAFTTHPQDSLYLKYRFGSLNYHLIQHFIVQNGKKTTLDAIWKNGIYFSIKGNHAWVEADRLEDSIKIRVQGPRADYVMSAIRYEFSEIHDRGPVEVLASYDGEYYTNLKEVNRQQRLFEDWHQSRKDELRVWDVSGTVKLEIKKLQWAIDLPPREKASFRGIPEVDQTEPKKALKIFISYAKEDTAHVDTLSRLLGPTETNGEVIIWYDRKIDQRTDWDEQIQREIISADVFVAVISLHYLAKEKRYIREQEEPEMIKRWTEEGIGIFPLLVGNCLWDKSVFSQAGVNFLEKGKIFKTTEDFITFIRLLKL